MYGPCRRYPLIGTEDPQSVKANRAFTNQSVQGIWDLGHITNTSKRLALRESDFGRGLENGKYPFRQDHSGMIGEYKLVWLTEIQPLSLITLVPDLIEGLSDKLESHWKVAASALVDLMKHTTLDKWIETIPAMTIAIKRVSALNNVEVGRRVLTMLKNLCQMQPGVGPDLAYYLHEILVDFNPYMEAKHNIGDHIVYNGKLTDDLYDEVDEVIRLFLHISGAEFDTAEKNVKIAIPTYQINRETYLN